ncbi:hypothetical protein [Roseateles sp. P5_D6]
MLPLVLMVTGLRAHRAGLDVDDHWNTQAEIKGPETGDLFG